jgi:hypothetical protein
METFMNINELKGPDIIHILISKIKTSKKLEEYDDHIGQVSPMI